MNIRHPQRTSNTMLKGVSAARRVDPNPASYKCLPLRVEGRPIKRQSTSCGTIQGMNSPHDITSLLAASRSDEKAAEQLFELVYSELRGIAGNQLRMEHADHTLQATALANEIYLKLVGQNRIDWQNRAQFFAVAARCSRRLLVDHARARLSAKRGGGAHHTSLTRADAQNHSSFDTELVALDEALTRLKEKEPLKHQVVEMRYFGGFTNEEIGKVLEVSTRTVDRHWRYSKAWLFRAIQGNDFEDATID